MDIKEAVATRIAASGRAVADRIIDALVEQTLAKRVNQITSAYTELDKLEKDIRRFKPDQVTYNEDGSVAASAYSKKLYDEKKAMSDRTAKVKKAIDAALDSGNWDLVAKLGDKPTNEPAKDN